jgi:hypothetical protein
MLPWLVTILSAFTVFVKDALMPPPLPMVETPQMSQQMLNRPYTGMYVDTPRNTQYRDDRLMAPAGLPLRETIQAAQTGLSQYHRSQMAMMPPAPR